MSVERKSGEPKKDNSPYEIQLGVPFEPYKGFRRYSLPGEGNKPFLVPESYSHILALRKDVSFHGMRGCIDIISEDPNEQWATLFSKFGMSQPLGLSGFHIDYYGKDDQRITKQPYILRLTFLPQNPSEYTKLLNSWVDVKMGKTDYVLYWRLRRPIEKKIMERLEQGQETFVTEKNLFEKQPLEAFEGEVEEDTDELEGDRFSYVWLPDNPDDIVNFRRIKLTFHQVFDPGNPETPTAPVEPERDRVPVRS